MEVPLPKKRGRPRKRPLPETDNDGAGKSVPDSKRQTRSSLKPPVALVGRYVLKEFSGNGSFLGKIVHYDTGLYRVDYEDGDCEDLESGELRRIVLAESSFTDALNRRRKKLDKRPSSKRAKPADVPEIDKSSASEACGEPVVEDNVDADDEAVSSDSSSESCEDELNEVLVSEVEPTLLPLAPQLPQSSGSIGVPEESVSHLLSVYGLLRSFSTALFLYPFSLDDLVGAVNCGVPNSLLDAIHVALMLVLKRHLESLSQEEGSDHASKCLRCVDWSLLDNLTWPVYVAHYLTGMGYVKGLEWRWFSDGVLEKDYHCLPVGRKLLILQILCDEVLESPELRAEIDAREEAEIGIDPDGVASHSADSRPRRVHPRYSKTSACNNKEAMAVISDGHDMKSPSYSNSRANPCGGPEIFPTVGSVDEDGNGDECRLCGMDGTLLCCDGCPSAYHSRCIGVVKTYIPEGPWYCPECTAYRLGPVITFGTSLVGGIVFGVDPYGQVFLGSCHHLLVLKTSVTERSYCRYYNQKDIVKVLQALNSSLPLGVLYLEISKAIVQYWNIPDSAFCLSKIIEMSTSSENDWDAKQRSSQLLISSGEESQKVSDAAEVQSASDVIGNQIRQGDGSFSGANDQQAEPNDTTYSRVWDRSSTDNHVVNRHSDSRISVNSLSSMVHQPTGQGVGDRNFASDCLFSGLLFKPQAYINQYVHAYFAASAAASLAAFSAEEDQVLEVHGTRNPKKVVSVISQQMKAFSSSTSRFFWPSSEKKLWEVPRERCGWCYTCRSTQTSKRGCMLNSAATIASKNAVKILSSLHLTKNCEGALPSMATYILLIEESFHGLIDGPFLNVNFRRDWRKMVVEAPGCVILKALLLKLEEHIRPVALTADWLKLVDDPLAESFVTQGATGTIQKRGPGGRRNKKQSALPEVTEDESLEKSFSWWRGGKLSKVLLNKAVLPRLMIRRAARQAGLTKIAGVHYVDGFEVPKRSRQSLWRAAVEMSKNASQLALQIRFLDQYLRWNDLVRPDLNLLDGKGPEVEASAFRNAGVCDKKLFKNKVVYGVDFGLQKHLPSRVMKTIIEVEPSSGANEKYWFYEAHVPLYLIKEYEEKLAKLCPSSKVPSNVFEKVQRMKFKAARMDIFSILICRRDNVEKFSCSSCRIDVSVRDVVICSACKGCCHDGCIISTNSSLNGQIQASMICKRCHHAKAFVKKEATESPTSPLLLQVRDCPKPKMVSEVPKIKIIIPPSVPVKPKEKAKSAASSTKARNTTWGIIWNKKNVDDPGSDFKKENILLRGSAQMNDLTCRLCQKPHNPNLIFIRCPSCSYWYHADALGVKESRVPEVLGFKCCKCRRIKSPDCPHDDKFKYNMKQQPSNLRQETRFLDSDSGDMSEMKGWEPATPMISSDGLSIQKVDPLLQSASCVEHIKDEIVDSASDWICASGPQKLPVRRHLKQESMASSNLATNDFSKMDPFMTGQTNHLACMNNTNWETPVDDELLLDLEGIEYEDMEFEPQTYFTFTELLDPDGGMQLGTEDAPAPRGLDNLEPTVANEGGFASSDELENAISLDTSMDVNCQICSRSEPLPDLSCEVCGICIHRQCSPWDASEFQSGSWRCGCCREWR